MTNRLAINRNNDKGFTLVELIVVLVILAVLAAILVPSLLGFIDRAKSKDISIEARYAYMDAQVALTEFYAQNKDVLDDYFAICKSKNNGYYDANGNLVKCSCITQSSLSTIQSIYTNNGGQAALDAHLNGFYEKYQNGDKSASFSYGAHGISAAVLKQMNSLNRKTAEYKFFIGMRASDQTYEEFYEQYKSGATKSNPVIYQVYFDDRGKILMFEYGKDGYLVRVENGTTTIEKNGKIYKNR